MLVVVAFLARVAPDSHLVLHLRQVLQLSTGHWCPAQGTLTQRAVRQFGRPRRERRLNFVPSHLIMYWRGVRVVWPTSRSYPLQNPLRESRIQSSDGPEDGDRLPLQQWRKIQPSHWVREPWSVGMQAWRLVERHSEPHPTAGSRKRPRHSWNRFPAKIGRYAGGES